MNMDSAGTPLFAQFWCDQAFPLSIVTGNCACLMDTLTVWTHPHPLDHCLPVTFLHELVIHKLICHWLSNWLMMSQHCNCGGPVVAWYKSDKEHYVWSTEDKLLIEIAEEIGPKTDPWWLLPYCWQPDSLTRSNIPDTCDPGGMRGLSGVHFWRRFKKLIVNCIKDCREIVLDQHC